MADDVGLQRAIMASLSAAPRPAPVPRAQHHGMTSNRAPPSGRDIAPTIPRRSSQRVSGTLAREGIKPMVKPKRDPSPHYTQQKGEHQPRPKTGDKGAEDGGLPAWRLTDKVQHEKEPSNEFSGMTKESSSPNKPTSYQPAPQYTRSPVQTKAAPNPKGQGKPAVPKQQTGKDPNAKSKENRDQFEAMIEDEILDRSPGVQWEDIASLEEPKRLLNEAVVLPMLMPSFFTGIRTPWKGVLLYGPPGTGKTMLAKAVATTGKTTFFNMSSSSLLSRYHGESEKMVRALFTKAREHAPSTIFFDEIDALVSSRGDAEHEVTRRVKTELLMQIDGISSVGDSRVMLLATTNRPWDIDEAMRRRLEKRIYVPLPDEAARSSLFTLYTKTLKFTTAQPKAPTAGGEETKQQGSHEAGLEELVAQTKGYSGADIQIMCRDAAMMPLRRAIMGLSPAELAAKSAELEAQKDEMEVDLQLDFLGSALKNVKPSVSTNDLKRYDEWTEDFSSV